MLTFTSHPATPLRVPPTATLVPAPRPGVEADRARELRPTLVVRPARLPGTQHRPPELRTMRRPLASLRRLPVTLLDQLHVMVPTALRLPVVHPLLELTRRRHLVDMRQRPRECMGRRLLAWLVGMMTHGMSSGREVFGWRSLAESSEGFEFVLLGNGLKSGERSSPKLIMRLEYKSFFSMVSSVHWYILHSRVIPTPLGVGVWAKAYSIQSTKSIFRSLRTTDALSDLDTNDLLTAHLGALDFPLVP
jgi:hypothetical protein